MLYKILSIGAFRIGAPLFEKGLCLYLLNWLLKLIYFSIQVLKSYCVLNKSITISNFKNKMYEINFNRY